MKENLDLAALDELIALTEKSLGSRFKKVPDEKEAQAVQDDEPDVEALASLYQE